MTRDQVVQALTRDQVVAAARLWLRTPWHHQGRLIGVGVDCAGVVIGVARSLGIPVLDREGYGHRPDGRELVALCHAQMTAIGPAAALPGDVLLIAFDGQPQHLGFATDVGLLHAHAAHRRVVEHRLDEDWTARIVAAFRLPGVE